MPENQWTLRDLLIATAVCAGFMACFGLLGYDNGLVWTVSVISLVLSACYVGAMSRKTPKGRGVSVLCVSLVFGIFSLFLLGSIALVASVTCHLCTIFFLTRLKRPKSVLLATSVCTLVGFSVGTGFSLMWSNTLEGMRDRYPVVDVTTRLAYEAEKELAIASKLPVINSDVDAHMNEQEQATSRARTLRRIQLRSLHSRQVANFVSAQGFGVLRLMYPRENWMKTQPLEDLTLDGTAEPEVSFATGWGQHIAAEGDRLHGMHQRSTYDFLDGAGFGAEIDGHGHAGFVSHAFHGQPSVRSRREKFEPNEPNNTQRLRLRSLQLVSLHRFEQPMVYATDKLPRMDVLSSDEVPVRRLDRFEASNLHRVCGPDLDVFTESEGTEVRMIGALRAINQCLECHSARRGEVLGVFSYRLEATDGPKE